MSILEELRRQHGVGGRTRQATPREVYEVIHLPQAGEPCDFASELERYGPTDEDVREKRDQ